MGRLRGEVKYSVMPSLAGEGNQDIAEPIQKGAPSGIRLAGGACLSQ